MPENVAAIEWRYRNEVEDTEKNIEPHAQVKQRGHRNPRRTQIHAGAFASDQLARCGTNEGSDNEAAKSKGDEQEIAERARDRSKNVAANGVAKILWRHWTRFRPSKDAIAT